MSHSVGCKYLYLGAWTLIIKPTRCRLQRRNEEFNLDSATDNGRLPVVPDESAWSASGRREL